MTARSTRTGRALRVVCLLAAVTASACGEAEPRPVPGATPPPAMSDPGGGPVGAAAGALLYVPVYSHVQHQSGKQVVYLTATVSVRNTDLTHAILVSRADYYDSAGTLLERYVDSPIRLGPLASTQFVVAQDDTRGGAGASFIVEWHADAVPSDPVVEAVMIGTSGQQGLSFLTHARVLRRTERPPPGDGAASPDSSIGDDRAPAS